MSSRFAFLLIGVVLTFSKIAAQESNQPPYVDVARISLSEPIRDKITRSYIEPGSPGYSRDPAEVIPGNRPFIKDTNYSAFIPVGKVTDLQLIRFNVCNSADTAISVWFFPGLYFYDISLFEISDERIVQLPNIIPQEPEEISYRKLTVAPHDSMKIVASMIMVRTHLNRFRPELINDHYLDSYVIKLDNRNMDSKIITYLFCGLLLMMVLFSLTSFFQNANPEFLYYSGYAFLLGLMLFIKAIYSYHATWFGFFQEGYLDYIMQSLGLLLYMLFMQRFLSTRNNHPVLDKLYRFGKAMLLVSMIIFTYFNYFTGNYVWQNRIENLSKVLLLVMIVFFLIYSLRYWKDRLLRYLFYGNLCLLFFSLLSLLLLTGNVIPPQLPYVFQTSLFYYELGTFLELVFFLTGLNHKHKRQLVSEARERERLKADNQMKEYEKEIAVYKAQQFERERISADMHDELGSGMTAIRLMSEIARNKMKETTPVEIDKISQFADEVLNKMNAIIWSMNSGNDTVDNLVSYIRSYALEYFEYTPITCRIFVPPAIPETELAGDRRRNLFLCVKETLNNTLKHSKATEVRINFVIDSALTITVRDNGVGADFQKIRQFGNGLKNITKRMNSIGGSYHLVNDNGTVSTFRLPLETVATQPDASDGN